MKDTVQIMAFIIILAGVIVTIAGFFIYIELSFFGGILIAMWGSCILIFAEVANRRGSDGV